jgi:hypothetical protein
MDNNDEYMKDPRAETVEDSVAGLGILSKYMEKGMQESYFLGGEHDQIHVYVDLEDLPEDSEDGPALVRLGFHASSATDAWSYFT